MSVYKVSLGKYPLHLCGTSILIYPNLTVRLVPDSTQYPQRRRREQMDYLLSHPVAQKICVLINDRVKELTASRVSDELGLSIQAATKALLSLERDAKLLVSEKKGRTRVFSPAGGLALGDVLSRVRQAGAATNMRGSWLLMQSLLEDLRNELREDGIEVLTSDSKDWIDTPLGTLRPDVTLKTRDGRLAAVMIGRFAPVGKNLVQVVGEAYLLSRFGKFDELLYVYLIPDKIASSMYPTRKFDEWAARDILKSLSDRIPVDLLTLHVDDQNLSNPAFVHELASGIKQKTMISK